MRIIGHTAVAIIAMLSVFMPRGASRRRSAVPHTSDLDRTGILVDAATPLEIRYEDADVIFPMYENSIAHSFWRAQEFSLFMQSKPIIEKPMLDLGCGDGSFARVLFNQVDYGSDIDNEALEIARGFGIYSTLVHSSASSIPLPDSSVRSVISNSVLEHVTNLDTIIGEVARILAPGGAFLYSVPVRQFATDLASYFGRSESERVNSDFFHRNLLEIDEWMAMLRKHGFSVVSLRHYQPDWFTFYYWMLRFFGRRGLGRLIPSLREKLWRWRGPQLVQMVKLSISPATMLGGNIFVVARKAAGRGG